MGYATQQPNEQLTGEVARVTFHSEETGFCVLRVTAKGFREPVTVVAHLPQVVAGESLEAKGQWIMDPKHGRQFKAEHVRSIPPDSPEGIAKFLGSGLIRGIGPVYARKLVDHFGARVFDVIEKESARLEEVEGIGRTRRLSIKDGWNETRAIRAIMAFLLGHGVSTARAFRIYKTYGEEAIVRVREDPYCLARDIHGIGFKSADQIAMRMGIAADSALRARAGVEYTLQELTHDGHCAYPRAELIARTVETLDIPESTVTEAVDHGLTERRLVEEPQPDGDRLIFLSALYQAECSLADRLRRLASGAHPCPAIDTEKALAWCEEKLGLTFHEVQREAIRAAVSAKVMALTGGPGVGKTTLINALIRIFHVKKLKVVLCAPTGRAAKRMQETTGHPAQTLHRLLVFDPKTGRFKHNERHPLQGDVFVVDEASMIDLPLAEQWVRALPLRAAVLWVGDIDQLPSVGPGRVLRDLIESDALPVVRLTHIFRQAEESAIVTNAHRINRGEAPVNPPKDARRDFALIEVEDPDEAARRIVELVARTLPSRKGFHPVRDIQVLTPMRRGSLGAHNLNALLQQTLNPQPQAVERFGFSFRTGDKVMQLVNDYDKDVFNGDIGYVDRVDPETREMVVTFDGRKVRYDLMELDELMPSYAVTIHKSQGSEYPCVVIPIHTQHYIMLQRNLLYTAVTRGKRMVVLVGTRKAAAMAARRQDTRRRITTLARRLREAG